MKKVIATLVLLTTAVVVIAQNTIKVQAPNVVAADEQFNVTFIIEGENSPSEFSWNGGDDFQIVWGPQRGTSSSITIVNGKRTKSSQSTFTYVLMPKKTGNLQIPEAYATVKGDEIHSSRVQIEVVSAGASGNSNSSTGRSNSSEGASSRSSTGEISSDDLFLRLSLSRTSVVVGEPLVATLKIYQRVNISGFEDAKFPQFTGFWSQELESPSNIEFKRESFDDKIYNTAVLRRWEIIPQQAGDIEIEPAELVCLVNIRNASMTGSIFDSFFQDDYRTIRKRIYSQAYKVKVSPLPSGAPASFGGGVGKFSISSSLSRDSLKTHEAASLFITVSGTGNVSLLEAPKVNFPPDFEVYDVKTSGNKTFEYPFIPRSHGHFTIDPVEYSYYDINTHKYVTLSTEALSIDVKKGEESAQSSAGQVVSVNKKDVKDIGSDIRYIDTSLPHFTSGNRFYYASTGFWILLVFLVALACAAYFGFKGVAQRRADIIGNKNRKASKVALKRLSQAGDFLQKNLYTAFYEELHRALLGYVSDKLNMDLAEMSKDNIASTLKASGVSESVASDLTELLDACEFARYSPDAGHDAMDAHYNSAIGIISSIDSSMKTGKSFKSGAAFLVLALLVSPSILDAQNKDYPDSLWTVGVEAYQNSMWSKAADAWEGIVSLGLESPELYYNLGNAYFREENYPRAILNYERAHKLDPSNEEVTHNLEYANEFTQDKIEAVPEIFIEVWGWAACTVLPSNVWCVLFFIFFAIALAMLVLFLFSSGRRKKIWFYTGIAVLLVSLLCVDFAQWQRTEYVKDTSAIVMKAVTSVKSSPSASSSTDLFILHEGAKVKVIDTVGEWNNVELADGRQGWIKSSDIERI